MLDVACAALNWLYALGRGGPVPQRPSTVQLKVGVRILTQLLGAAALLAEAPPKSFGGACAFRTLTQQDASSAYPSLEADRIALVDGCGILDPVPCLPDRYALVVESPDLMFPGGTSRLPKSITFDGGSRDEYVTLVRRQLRAGKVSLVIEAGAVGRVFSIAKRGTDQQREIWHGGLVTEAAASPPAPPELANPAALADL
mmetsp:Transcript_179200/g.568661  ORF Transcript_179200/g.568661 Transcript_179200/m.568661 type:complete len:200 (-) Transcript_179200:46-645(-)